MINPLKNKKPITIFIPKTTFYISTRNNLSITHYNVVIFLNLRVENTSYFNSELLQKNYFDNKIETIKK